MNLASNSSKYVPQSTELLARQPYGHAWARHLWALPMLLSLIFVAAVVVWLQRADSLELEERRQTMIADALTLETQLRSQLEFESLRLEGIGKSMQSGLFTVTQFEQNTEINAGLARVWQAVTWLDRNNRVVAHIGLPSTELGALWPAMTSAESVRGISSHLVASIRDEDGRISGSLVARYSPTALLKRGVPWWLARKYQVRLIDSLDQQLAISEDVPPQKTARASYAVSFDPPVRDASLELVEHAAFVPWYRGLPPFLMGGFLLLVLIATSMLRRQMRSVLRAESAWRTEAAWRGAMEDSMVVGLRARDFDGRLVYVNRTFAEMVGWSREELIGISTPMPYWSPEQIEETMQRHRRNMAGEAPREGYEARWRHRDGRALDVMVFETPLVDARGTQIGWMGSILEITERKVMEERDRKQADTLAHHARLTMLGEIASTLAHELNQPLSAIASYNAGVINSLTRDGFTDADVHEALQRLGAQAAQAGRIVQRIREFLTRREPVHEACEIHQVVTHAIRLFRRELDHHQVTVSVINPDESVRVMADPVLIEQVIINLLRNATDALMANTERRIEVAIRRSGERFVRIDITDNGPGLAGRTIQQLCTAFYSTKPDGMGMGLAICRSIVEAHEGAFDVTEAPARFAQSGAAFSLSLPLVRDSNAADKLNQHLREAAE